MASLTKREKDQREEKLQKAITHYENSVLANIRHSAERFGVPYSTLRGRLAGAQNRVAGQLKAQALTDYEENSIVRWCAQLDEWGHPQRLAVVRSMAQASIVQRHEKDRQIGHHWLARFLKRHPELASHLSTRLDRQRALASDPVVIKDYFRKVNSLCIPIS